MQATTSFPKLAGTILLLLAGNANAENLSTIYSLAEQNDPQFRAAKDSYMADSEAPYQAWGAMLPQISGAMYQSTSTGDTTLTSGTTNYDYTSNGYSLNLTQTIYNHAKFAQISQASAAAAQALAKFHNAEQELILNAAERYFNVLAAQDNLDFTRAEKKSIAHQLQQTQQRFNVGLTAITDVHEAQARYDQTVASDIAAENKLAISREILREMTGKDHAKLDSLLETTPLLEPNPNNIDAWVKTALSNNFLLLAARQSVEAASAGISKARAGHYPSLDVIASKSYNDVGGGMFGATTQDDTTVKLQLSMAIFNGGAVMSQSREASYRHMQSKEILEPRHRTSGAQRLSIGAGQHQPGQGPETGAGLQ